jgi:CTP synthase
MMNEKLDRICLKKLNITQYNEPELTKWKGFLDKLKYPKSKVTIGLIGKYIELQDAYKSILEAFVHAGAMNECKVQVVNVHSEFITNENVAEKLGNLDGLLVAPGFGHRGVDGKITAVKFARENKLPFFGICLGMQMAVIEFAKNVLGLKGAHSTEMDPDTKDPVIENSLAKQIYDKNVINERHRHRWEFNNHYLSQYENAGMVASGVNTESGLVEIVELPSHPFFLGVQYHPELKSTVENPQPVFVHFIKAAKEYAEQKSALKNPVLQSEMV